MRIADEKKITLIKEYSNGNKVIREFITERNNIPVSIIRSITITNNNHKRTQREFYVDKELGNLAYTNNIKAGFLKK